MKNKKIFLENKRGWIKIIEAFFAILLIAGVLLFVINKGYPQEDISIKIYEKETEILREIEINSSLRGDILSVSLVPVEWANFTSAGLIKVKNKIISKIPNYLNCSAKLCEINKECKIEQPTLKDVYATSVGIFANAEEYSPKQLRLFCWEGRPPELEEVPPEEIPEELEKMCTDAGGVCKTDPCSEYDDCTLLDETCVKVIVETGCVWDFDDECNEWSGGGVRIGGCGPFGAKDSYVCYDYSCTSLEEACGSEYCCSGSCTEKTCASLEGTICTGDQTCSGTLLDASDSDRCCSEACVNPQAILTLLFSNVVYSWNGTD
ncbi:MAG: hypothetical protein KKF67_02365, partial [Nanoarchaeota archaeon]|nr:hypothetical protein [Nanoarchaeota archaeon]